MTNKTKFDNLLYKYELEDSGLYNVLKTPLNSNLLPINTLEKYKKILRSDKWFNGYIIKNNNIYGLEKHANWTNYGNTNNYLFLPNKFNFNPIYGVICMFCNNKSCPVYKFENEDDDVILNIKKKMMKCLVANMIMNFLNMKIMIYIMMKKIFVGIV